MPCADVQNAAACTARVSILIFLQRQSRDRAHDLAGRERTAVRHDGSGAYRFGNGVDAADAAAGRAGDMPTPLADRLGGFGREPSDVAEDFCINGLRNRLPSGHAANKGIAR
jgi:hypothetical protein